MSRFAVAATAAFGLGLVAMSATASASVYTVPLDVTSGFDSEAFPVGKLPRSGSFTEDFTFSLPSSGYLWDLSAFIGVTSPKSGWLPTSSTFTLYEINSNVPLASTSFIAGYASLGSLGDIMLTPGDYYLEWTGASHKDLAWSGAITVSDPVPELQTWAMLMFGFAGMGLWGYRFKLRPRYAL